MTLTVGLASCGEPTPPLRLDTYPFRYDLFGDSTRLLTFHWPVDRMPVRFWSDPADSLSAYVTYAIEQWEAQFLYGEFTGVVVADSAQADIIVHTSPAAPTGSLANIPSSELVTGCSGVTGADSIAADTEIVGHMRSQVFWSFGVTTYADSQAQVRCLARVVTHEVGHALGILSNNPQHAGTDSTDIMFTFPRVAVPSERDRETIQRLYHTPSDILAPVRPR